MNRGQVLLDFSDGDGGEEFGKEEKEEHEQAKRCYGEAEFHPSKVIKTPLVGNEILGHGPDDDHEAFGPHADIDEDGDDEKGCQAGSYLLEEEK